MSSTRRSEIWKTAGIRTGRLAWRKGGVAALQHRRPMWTPTPTAPSTPAPRANTWDARRLFLLCPRHFRKGSKATRRPLLQWDRSADFGLAVLVSERRVVFITFGRIRR